MISDVHMTDKPWYRAFVEHARLSPSTDRIAAAAACRCKYGTTSRAIAEFESLGYLVKTGGENRYMNATAKGMGLEEINGDPIEKTKEPHREAAVRATALLESDFIPRWSAFLRGEGSGTIEKKR